MNPHSRRDLLKMMGAGFGSLGLASVLNAEDLLGSGDPPAGGGRAAELPALEYV